MNLTLLAAICLYIAIYMYINNFIYPNIVICQSIIRPLSQQKGFETEFMEIIDC